MLKNYYVVVNDPEDKDSVHQDLINFLRPSPRGIPNRPVTCVDPMPGSLHNGIFQLTDSEAAALKNNPKVLDVHLSPEEEGFFKGRHGSRTGSYSKNSTFSSSTKNWGLARCISATENFGASNTLTSYTYNLDGTGVDIIVMDTGVEPGHPEFAVNADGTGGSRVIDYDWTQLGIITSVPTGGFLGDNEGHGSNCASIAAGNTCGWAPNANIYSLRIVSSGNVTDKDITDGRTLGLVDEHQAWQSIRLFHLNKSVDPNTGYKRPTIVNCSYGYFNGYSNISSITYRGITRSTNTTSGIYGALGVPEGNSEGVHGVRISSLESDISSVISAGVVVLGAAGNNNHKIDVSTGTDYNNYWTNHSSSSYSYHQGSTPGAANNVICVGAMSWSLPEHKINFSCTGPRVDIFSPGTYIMGAYSSSTFVYPSVPDTRNNLYYLNSISGTSQATPQVAGVCALLLQLRPWMTPTQVRAWITGNSVKSLLSETYYGTSGTYTNFASLQGSTGGILYIPFHDPNPMKINF